MKLIDISTKTFTNKFVIVDEDEFEELNKVKWHFMKGYAVRRVYFGSENGKQIFKDIYMHRLINHTPDGFETDHINRDKLDNRKVNLKSVTSSQNKINKGIRKDNRSGINGIYFDKSRNLWAVEIMLDKKKIYLGRFKNMEDARIARKFGEEKYFGSSSI